MICCIPQCHGWWSYIHMYWWYNIVSVIKLVNPLETTRTLLLLHTRVSTLLLRRHCIFMTHLVKPTAWWPLYTKKHLSWRSSLWTSYQGSHYIRLLFAVWCVSKPPFAFVFFFNEKINMSVYVCEMLNSHKICTFLYMSTRTGESIYNYGNYFVVTNRKRLHENRRYTILFWSHKIPPITHTVDQA